MRAWAHWPALFVASITGGATRRPLPSSKGRRGPPPRGSPALRTSFRRPGTSFWAAVLVQLAGAAQAQTTAAVSFGEARAQAERLAPIVRLAGKHIDIARAEVDVAGTLQNPTFTVQSATKSAHLGTFVSV